MWKGESVFCLGSGKVDWVLFVCITFVACQPAGRPSSNNARRFFWTGVSGWGVRILCADRFRSVCMCVCVSQRWENVEVLGYGFFAAVGLRDAFCGLLAFNFTWILVYFIHV